MLTSIGGEFTVANTALISFTGLESLYSISQDFLIWNNDSLITLAGLDNLIFIGGTCHIVYNDSLASLAGLGRLSTVGEAISVVDNKALVSLAGMNSLTSLEGALFIASNNTLTSLTGLAGLSSFGSLILYGNNSLTNLMGLEQLDSLADSLQIVENLSLTSLTGLDNLTLIGGFLKIVADKSLVSITALQGLTSIGGELRLTFNQKLTDLAGLENIDAGSIDNLVIAYNNLLSSCKVKSICDYLAKPNGFIEIHDNASGCDSQGEVEEACGVRVPENLSERKCIVFPNPSDKLFTITFTLKHSIHICLKVLNWLGQVIVIIVDESLPEGEQQIIWNAEDIPPGIYFYELTADSKIETGKLIVIR